MTRSLIALCVLFAASQGLVAQVGPPMAGVYTCANGNPGNAFDYGDIGDFFTGLEDRGMGGPVTLDIFDDGGPFVSKPSYLLAGNAAQPAPFGLVGHGPAAPLLLRTATGERPEIIGAGADDASLRFQDIIGYLTIEGLVVRDLQGYGLRFQGIPGSSNLRIAECKFHGIEGTAILISYDEVLPTGVSGTDAVVIENNMIWNCWGTHSPQQVGHAVVGGFPGLEWIVRHNTIAHVNAAISSCVFAFGSAVPGSMAIEQFHSNVVHLHSTLAGQTEGEYAYALAILPPLFCDFNVYHLAGTARFAWGRLPPLSPAPSYPITFAQWQAAGFDVNGLLADPMLVSTVPGLEDLHLQPNSPARDLSPINSVATDIDGEPRPYGPRRDAGADEWNPGGIEVQHAAAAPVAGVIDVGGIPANGAARVFSIHSTGPGHLKLTGNPLVAIALGANCDPLTGVQVQPPLTYIRVGNSTDFTVLIRPLGAGVFNFTLTIESNALNSPLVITVTGAGQAANGPAHAIMAAGTSFMGPMNGPFNLTLQPGAALVNATIELLDPDADLIVVQSVTALGPAPAGILPPQISVPMHPRILTFTGTAGATNPPGVYTWRVAFRDAVNASVITIDCIITIADLPPTHLIAAAFGGDGSAGNAYQAAFNRGDDAAAGINLCTVSDPNTGQALTLAGATKIAGPGAVGFDLTLTAGTLRVSPAGTLTFTEQGLHQYEAEVSDGLNTVSIFVSISVTGAAINFTNPSQLPTATVGEAVSLQLGVTGAIGPATFTITTGQLPDGLTMDSTGQVTGTPTKAETATFTIEAEDTTGATGTRAFTMETTNPPTPPGPNEQDTGSGGCTAGASASALWTLLLVPALTRRRRS